MPATLSEHLATLTTKLAAADPISVRFRRGSQSAIVTGANGMDLRWPYNGAGFPPVGKRFWLTTPITLAGVTIMPREGDILEGVTPAAIADRRFELVPYGEEPPCAPAHVGTTLRVHALDTTDAPRRDTVVDLYKPDPDATRAASGNKDRTAVVVVTEDIAVRVEAQEGNTDTVGGKSQQVRIFRVTMAARNIPASARLKVTSGWLEEQRLADEADGKTVADAVWLYVEAVSRDSAYGLETACVCRLVGG